MRAYLLPDDPEACAEISRIWREVEAEYAVLTEDELTALEAAEYVDDPDDDEAMAEIYRMKWRHTARFGHDVRRYGEYMGEVQRRIAHLVRWVTLDGDEDEPDGR